MEKNKDGYIYQALMCKSLKPYGKLTKLIQHAFTSGVISEWEADAMETELQFLVSGHNRSHDTIPRGYIEQELDHLASTSA